MPDPLPPDVGHDAAAPPGACAGCRRRIVRINAHVPTTQSFRMKAAVPPPDKSHDFSSSSNTKSLSANHPTVLLRNCSPVVLEAVTDPPNQNDVAWDVAPNPGPDPKPGLAQKTGLTSKLTTDASGGYAVSATLDGTTVYWNVVFVEITLKDSTMKTGGRFEDDSKWDAITVSSGLASNTHPDDCAMWVQAKVQLIAGGKPELTPYLDKIHLGFTQNATDDTVAAYYKTTGKEKPLRVRERVVHPNPISPAFDDPKNKATDLGYPVLDKDPKDKEATGGNTIFLNANSSDVETGKARMITVNDCPTIQLHDKFPGPGPHTGRKIDKITGINEFGIYLVAYSDDANFSYVAFGKATNHPPRSRGSRRRPGGISGFVSPLKPLVRLAAGQEWGRSPRPRGRFGRPCWLVVVGSFESGSQKRVTFSFLS